MKLKTLLVLWGIVAVSLMAETALAAKPECAGIENKSRGEQFKLKRLHGCKVPEVSYKSAPDPERLKQLKQRAEHKRAHPRPYIEYQTDTFFEASVRRTKLVVDGKVVPNPTWQKFLAGDKTHRASAIHSAACEGSSTHLRQALDAAGRMGIRRSTSWNNPTKPYYREGALHCAAWLGNFDKVKMLIKHGFYPSPKAKDSKGGSGKTPRDLAPSTPEGKKIVGFLNEAEHIWKLPKNEREARINLLVLEYDRAAPAPEPEEKKAEKIPTLAEMLEEIKKLEGQ